MQPRQSRTLLLSFVIASLLLSICSVTSQSQAAPPSTASATSIPASQQIQPEELNRILAGNSGKPLVLQVGSQVMFSQAHIWGSEYAGPGSQESGRKRLQDRVVALPHSTFIVLYCGCCPWERCPNLGPAYWLLNNLGFTHVKVLYIADNFGTNWVDKGFPVERSN